MTFFEPLSFGSMVREYFDIVASCIYSTFCSLFNYFGPFVRVTPRHASETNGASNGFHDDHRASHAVKKQGRRSPVTDEMNIDELEEPIGQRVRFVNIQVI